MAKSNKKIVPQIAPAQQTTSPPKKPRRPKPPRQRNFKGSIFSFPPHVPQQFRVAIQRIEALMQMPVWSMIQNANPDYHCRRVSMKVYKGFQSALVNSRDRRIALLIDSPGGDPDAAFRIARLFQRRGIAFTAIIPQYAKSAATLLALGATEIIMGRDAEIGPIDMQHFDAEREELDSALNAVQALERLNAFGLTAMDQTMQYLLRRFPKKTDVLLTLAFNHVTGLLKPMLEKIDAVEYARKSRSLKVAEDYAARLMRNKYGFERGRVIARRIIENFSDHGFVVDRDEVVTDNADDVLGGFGIGLKVELAAPELQTILDELTPSLDSLTVIGRLEEVRNG